MDDGDVKKPVVLQTYVSEVAFNRFKASLALKGLKVSEWAEAAIIEESKKINI